MIGFSQSDLPVTSGKSRRETLNALSLSRRHCICNGLSPSDAGGRLTCEQLRGKRINAHNMTTPRTTVHIARPNEEQASLLRLLSAEEKLQALVRAAQAKASRLGATGSPIGTTQPNQGSTGEGDRGD